MGLGRGKKTYSDREVRKILRANGFKYERSKGDHDIYKREGVHVSIPCRINKMLWQRLMKEHNLEV